MSGALETALSSWPTLLAESAVKIADEENVLCILNDTWLKPLVQQYIASFTFFKTKYAVDGASTV